MSPSNKERVAGFVEKLLASMRDVGGKQGIDSEALASLVRDDPDAAAGAVFVLLKAEEVQRGSRQLATAVAMAYQSVTGDDSLSLRAKRAIQEAGGRMPTIVTEGGEPPPPARIGVLQVRAEDLARGDIYNLLRLFRVDRPENPAAVTGMRGRFLLAFPVDDDPRPVWQIPAVREFIHKVFEAMPYFPYYLHFAEEYGSFMLFFGCLADADAFQPAGRKVQLSEGMRKTKQIVRNYREMKRRQGLAVAAGDPTGVMLINVLHPSVLAPVAVAANAIRSLCQQLGEDPTQALDQLLIPYHPEMRKEIMDAVSEPDLDEIKE